MNDPRRFSPGILVGLLAVLALAHLAKSARCIAHPRLFEDGLHREVVRSDGSRLAARIVSVDRNWNVRVETDDRQFVFNETELVYWGHVEPIVRGPIVVLDNGDMIVGEVRRIFTDRIAIESRYWQAVEVPLDRVVGVLLRPALDPLSRDQQILTLLDLATDRDQVKLTTGDSLSGFVMESLSAENEAATPRWKELGSVVVELDGESIQLPSNSIESIRWSGKGRERDASRSTPRFIGMRDGSWFACDEVRAQRDHVEFRLSCGVTLKTRIADGLSRGMRRIGAVYPAQEQFVFLSRLKPAQFQSLPALTSSIPYAADRNVRGGMLRKSNALIPFGIGMHSAASLAFATDGDFRRLRAELALDRCAGNGGSVVFTIHVSRDGTTWEQAYSSPVIRGGDKSLPIDVDITEAKYVALGVGFADRGDVLDHANWLHARLVK